MRLVVLLALLVPAVSSVPRAAARLAGDGSGPQLANIDWFWNAIADADNVQLLEGLPHPSERDTLAAEMARITPIEIGGQMLYPKPLDAPPAVIEELKMRFRDRTVFRAPILGGPVSVKLCGGFHADYAVVWSIGQRRVATALLCFGCADVRLVGGNSTLTTAFQPYMSQQLGDLLRPLRQNRPPYAAIERKTEPPPEPVRALVDVPKPELESQAAPHPDVDLPNDVVQKAVEQSAREPLADEDTNFWWLDQLLSPKRSPAGSAMR